MFDQGEMVDSSKPAPRASNNNDNAAMINVPPSTAPQDTPGEEKSRSYEGMDNSEVGIEIFP
jgi:hypothetical protein